MNDAHLHDDRTPRLSRRHLLAAGGAGVAALWLAPIGGVAEAATLRPELKRSTWLGLSDPNLTGDLAGRSAALRLAEVADLPVAATVAPLRGHDAAFALRFTGPAGLPQGIYALRHAALGTLELFLAPVGAAGADLRYEAIVDRTVRVAGVNEEGTPVRVSVPDERGALPRADAPAPAMVSAAGTPLTPAAAPPGPPRRPRVRRLTGRRAANHRSAILELSVADLGTTRTVNALVLTRGRVVARGVLVVRPGRPLRVRLAARRTLAHGRHQVVLSFVDAEGRTTRLRRRVRLV
jgi:hypothetical protein